MTARAADGNGDVRATIPLAAWEYEIEQPFEVLRQFAQLDGKCFIVGQGDRVEMWDVSVWNEMFDPACLAEHDLTGLNL